MRLQSLSCVIENESQLEAVPGLQPVCFKLWHQLRCTCLANSQKIATDKRPFYNHSWPFFCQLYFIFYKTEVQTVISKCLTSLNPNWFKSYDTKHKNARNANECFCTKSQKSEMEIFALCVITFEPIRI